MLDKSKLMKILMERPSEKALAFRTRESMKVDSCEIASGVNQTEFALNKLDVPMSDEYRSLKDNYLDTVKGFYGFLDEKIKDKYGSMKLVVPKPSKINWAENIHKSNDGNEVFEYRVALSKEKHKVCNEVEAVEKLLKKIDVKISLPELKEQESKFSNAADKYYDFASVKIREAENNLNLPKNENFSFADYPMETALRAPRE